MPNRCLTPISFLQEFYLKAGEIENDVMINVTNDFHVKHFQAGPHRSKMWIQLGALSVL